jgi:hypothetical protein
LRKTRTRQAKTKIRAGFHPTAPSPVTKFEGSDIENVIVICTRVQVASKDPAQSLPTSVQKSYFVLSRSERAGFDTALQKYRPGRTALIAIGGIAQLTVGRRSTSREEQSISLEELRRVFGLESVVALDFAIKTLDYSKGTTRLKTSAVNRSPANSEMPAPKKTTSRKIGPAKLSRLGIGVSRLPVKSPPAPLPEFVETMKAQLVDSIPPGDWLYEIKFDGRNPAS